MHNLQIDNLDEQPISFDLNDEDLQSIKGGLTVIEDISLKKKPWFPIKIGPICIYPIRIFIIEIKAYPIDPNLEIKEGVPPNLDIKQYLNSNI